MPSPSELARQETEWTDVPVCPRQKAEALIRLCSTLEIEARRMGRFDDAALWNDFSCHWEDKLAALETDNG